jgi:pimeloyl-ACP methyl ester carboxylesterase
MSPSKSPIRTLNRSARLAAALLTGALMLTTTQGAVAADAGTGVHNIVLVHGAWADGSSWSKLIPLLQAKGFHVVAVQNPLNSLADDVAATKRAIALQDGPVLLVGHSYGGGVITEAGNDPKVAGLVYVAAFAPDAGEAVGELGKEFPPPPGLAEMRPDAGGYLSLTPKGMDENFAPDLPAAARKLMTATQGPTNGACFGAKITSAAWRTKPSWYVVATNDRMIPPDLERKFAKAMNAKTLSLPSSHVPMLSHPAEVASFVADAAKTVASK